MIIFLLPFYHVLLVICTKQRIEFIRSDLFCSKVSTKCTSLSNMVVVFVRVVCLCDVCSIIIEGEIVNPLFLVLLPKGVYA